MNRLCVVLTAACAIWITGCSERSTNTQAAKSVVAAPTALATVPGAFDVPGHTDENWVNGIASGWGAAFFVMLVPGMQDVMAMGNEVTFVDGTKRRIQSTRVNGETLIVNLEGPPLDGKSVGHPNKLRVDRPKP